VNRTKRDHFCNLSPTAPCIAGFSDDVPSQAGGFRKIETPSENQPHWSRAQGIASSVIESPEEERRDGYE
jgi:hypothetical protein